MCGSWDSAGARLLANDLVITAAQQTRALRSLAAGLLRADGASRSAGRAEAAPLGRLTAGRAYPEKVRGGRRSKKARRKRTKSPTRRRTDALSGSAAGLPHVEKEAETGDRWNLTDHHRRAQHRWGDG